MGYLDPTEYEDYGLIDDTTDDWIRAASALINSYCRRTDLNVVTYVERLRIVSGSQTVRLTYLPLTPADGKDSPLVAVRARYGRPRRGEIEDPMTEIALAFQVAGTWRTLDANSIDFFPETGEITLPFNLMNLPYTEVEVTYTAGLTVIPDSVKLACAQIVKNAQTVPSQNIKSAHFDSLQMDYFGSSLIDDQVKAWLRPYVAQRLG